MSAAMTSAPSHAAMLTSATPTVLVVDDEELIGPLLTAMLQWLGCNTRIARTGTEAVEHLSADPTVALALLDVRMPGLDGPETLRLLRGIQPQLPCCFMTGDIGNYTHADLWSRGVVGILQKPFHLGDLAAILRRAGLSEGRKNEE